MAESKLLFKYKYAEDYNPLFANGAFGGVSPRGDIIINFFMDKPTVPDVQRLNFDENGYARSVENVSHEEDMFDVIRHVQTGVVMDMTTAKALRDWLVEQIEALEGAATEQKREE